ncbi:MAG: hypothetical protein HY275_15030, partial [Gemmatimonadetes bacterium]|nr:hypothetical protein [Gemmatimonadota bacterium]
MTAPRPLLVALLSLRVVTTSAAQGAPGAALHDSLARWREPVIAAPCGLDGAGGRKLVDAVREAQFTIIGEAHGIAEAPGVVERLFCAGAKVGYRYLAIETGATVTRELERRARAASPESAMTDFATRYAP